jgi:hypothetical protein
MKMVRNILTMVVFVILLIFLYLQQLEKYEKIMKAFDWLISRGDYEEHYIEQIKHLCGDLCDLEKEISPGDFMGSVKAQVIQIFQS